MYLGVEPRDPFRSDGGPLALITGTDEVGAYSWYEDGIDDGASGTPWALRKSADLVVVTRAPK